MVNLKDWIISLCLASIAILSPIHPVMITVGILVFADLTLGIYASKKRGDKIESSAMRRTVSKLLIYQVVIITGFICEKYLIFDLIPISKLCAATIGLVEIKSILENANEINGSSLFKSIIEKLGSENDKK